MDPSKPPAAVALDRDEALRAHSASALASDALVSRPLPSPRAPNPDATAFLFTGSGGRAPVPTFALSPSRAGRREIGTAVGSLSGPDCLPGQSSDEFAGPGEQVDKDDAPERDDKRRDTAGDTLSPAQTASHPRAWDCACQM